MATIWDAIKKKTEEIKKKPGDVKHYMNHEIMTNHDWD